MQSLFFRKLITAAAIVLLLISCNKEMSKGVVVKTEADASANNRQLIAGLLAGTPFKMHNKTINFSSPDSGRYTLTLEDGMLKFDNAVGLNNFLKAVDIVVADWDNSDDKALDGLFSKKKLVRAAVLRSFDSAMGFHSLRKKYDMLYADDPDFKDTIRTLVINPDYLMILNENNEMQIGDTIHRYLSSDIVAKIYNSDYNALHLLRNSGRTIIKNVNIKYYRTSTNTEYLILW